MTHMHIGYTHNFPVTARDHTSIFLDGADLGTLQLPVAQAPDCQPGDSLSVFVYSGTNGNAVATCQRPLVERDQCACLEVVAINTAGAFLDWGLDKNLFLPFAEQRRPLTVGRHECVLVYLDNTGRLAASSRLDHHLPDTSQDLKPWQSVELLIYQRTELGYKAVVNHHCLGLVYKDEIFKPIRVGQTQRGYIKRIRPDGRLDLTLQARRQQLQPQLTEQILAYLDENQGVCHLSDHSSPDEIKAVFQVSKKNFKRAISTLYKERKIVIEADRIHRTKQPSEHQGKASRSRSD